MRDWHALAQGVDAAEEILVALGLEELLKGLDPMKADDFVLISARLGKSLERAAKGTEQKALNAALGELDVNWSQLNKAQKNVILKETTRLIRSAGDVIAPKAGAIAGRTGEKVYKQTRASTAASFDLTLNKGLSDHDQRAVAWLKSSQTAFVRDAFGRRAVRFSARAKDIVADGLGKGLGDREIAEELTAKLGGLGRSEDYWQIVSNVFCQRARTYSAMSAYSEAGITHYTWLSMMDEATSLQCRFMHGQTFEVAGAMGVIEEVQTLDDPESIVTAQPWLRLGHDNEKRPVLMYETRTQRQAIARVDQSALGRAGERGAFTELTRSLPPGITMPPAHARCRSTVVPEV